MNNSFMFIIPKLSSSHHNGNPLLNIDWKNQTKITIKPKWYWLFWLQGCYALWVYSARSDYWQTFPLTNVAVFMMQCITDGCRSGNLANGKFTTCVAKFSYMQYSTSECLPKYQIQFTVTFFCSPHSEKKMPWKGKIYVETTEHHAIQQLLPVPKTEFKRCFHHWQMQWKRCTCAEAATSKRINLLSL